VNKKKAKKNTKIVKIEINKFFVPKKFSLRTKVNEKESGETTFLYVFISGCRTKN
jgi:hypothetical protein